MSEAPRLPPGTRFTFDKVRNRWCLLAPERLFEIDEQVADVLQHVDGRLSLEEIVARVAVEYDAPAATIREDVTRLFADLAGKGLLIS